MRLLINIWWQQALGNTSATGRRMLSDDNVVVAELDKAFIRGLHNGGTQTPGTTRLASL